jgi:hypothetical protein
MAGHAVEASRHWPPVNASDTIAIQAVLIAGAESILHRRNGCTGLVGQSVTSGAATD